MKVVAVFVVTCIAVAFAYPMTNEEEIEIQEGDPVFYDVKLNKWVPQASMQQNCKTGKLYQYQWG